MHTRGELAEDRKGKQVLDFPGYNVICEIGRGGMATVYRARQVMLDREVALKVLSPALAADPANAQRFLQEARMLASLEHPHVVPVYDVGVTPDGSHYFSMQLLENGDFTARLQRGVSEAELVRVLSAVADALAYAHARGYVHRDVTPSNILFDADDKPRLTDFGIARAMAVTSRITALGLSVGTSHYMSPEQARGNEVDPRSDIYSLGVLCYEALTGKPPFMGEDSFAVAYAHVYEPVPPLPLELAKWQPLIERCMAKNPQDRIQDCGQFIAVMRRIVFASRAPEARAASRARGETTTLVVDEAAQQAADFPAGSDHEDDGATLSTLAEEASASSNPPAWVGPVWGFVGLFVVLALTAGWWLQARTTASDALSRFSFWSLSTQDELPAETRDELTSSDISAAETAGKSDPIEMMLDQARKDFDEQRYTTPEGSNALERYRLVLRIEPDNAEARAGIERVAAVYVELADQRVGDHDPAQWLRHIQRADELAQQFDVEAVGEAVASRRAGRLRQALKDADAALARERGASATALYQFALALSPNLTQAREGLARAQKMIQSGYTFHDRIGSHDGPRMIITQRLAFSQSPITVGEFMVYWNTAGVQRFGTDFPTCRDRESIFRSFRRRTPIDPGFTQGDNHPVVCISAPIADDYARWLSVGSGNTYRIPSAAELVGAGVGAAQDCAQGNIRDSSYRSSVGGREYTACDDGYAHTSPVSAFKPARNGLRDVAGNVREWSADCADSNCRERVVVGASWASLAGAHARRSFPAATGSNTIGLRVVREIH